jgi:SAM-dependent methyltransferase
MTDWADYYRKAWAKRTEIFDTLMQQEQSMPRVLGQFDWWERHNRLMMNTSTGEMLYAPTHAKPAPTTNITPFIFDHIKPGFHRVIVEYGCGYGKRLLELSLAGCELPMFGLDLSPEGVALGKKLAALDDAANVGFDVAGWEYVAPRKALIFTCYTAMYQDPFPEEWFQQYATIVMIEPEETIQRLRLRERGIPCTSL